MSNPEIGPDKLQKEAQPELVSPANADDPNKLVGALINDRYHIESLIGEGGMGAVYKARHVLLRKTVAIKFLKTESSGSARAIQRFKQEAKAASALSHEHIATVREFGFAPDGGPYLVMDYVDGTSLSEVLKKGSLEPRRVLSIFMQACQAMAYAHKHGVLHRDLKPANILLTDEGKEHDSVRIVDFGLAKILYEDGQESVNLTQTGELFGTPLYMSPEQCQGNKLDGRSDIYSIGCVMYEALVGKPPFTAENNIGLIYKHVNEAPTPFANLATSDKALMQCLENVVLCCLEKNPDHRYKSMDELFDVLVLVKDGKTPAISAARAARHRRNLLRFGASLAAVLAVSILLVYVALSISPAIKESFFAQPWNKLRQAAAVQASIGEYAAAEALLRKAIQEAEIGNASDYERFPLFYELGKICFEQKNVNDAQAAFIAALRLVDQKEHPLEAANTREQIANCYLWLHHGEHNQTSSEVTSDYRDGIRLSLEALKLKEATVGPEHPYVAYPLEKLAALYHAVGDYTNAEKSWRRAIMIELKDDSSRARAMKYLPSLANTLLAQGKRTEAQECYRQAIELAKKLFGPDSVQCKQLEQLSKQAMSHGGH